MQEIGKFTLKNQGGFVVKMEFKYLNENGVMQRTKGTGDITLGFSKTEDPGKYGVPDGANVLLYANVVAGTDNEANQMFTYKSGCTAVASYVISGTTLDNELGFTGIK